MLTEINHITWNVRDVDEAFDFYVNLLGFTPIMKSPRSAYFTLGGLWLAVVLGGARNDDRYDHIAFGIAPKNFSHFTEKLKMHGVTSWQENVSAGNSFYFLDPSGNKFEVHAADLRARIQHGKAHWDKDVTWYV